MPIAANETTFVMANLVSGKIEINNEEWNQDAKSIKNAKSPNGFALEIGIGHNQLFWSWPSGYPYSARSRDRTSISIAPTARVLLDISLSDVLYLRPFLGYDRFGGIGKRRSDGYKDSYWWHAIEFGTAISYKLGKYYVDGGIKLNRCSA